MEYTLTDSANEVEQTVLGCLFLKSKLLEESYLTEDHFANPIHKFIYRIFLESYKKYKTIDIVLLSNDHEEEFRKNNSHLLMYITDIMSSVPSAANYSWYQDKVIQEYKNRLIFRDINKFQRKELNEQELMESLNNIQSLSFGKDTEYYSGEYIYKTITREDKLIHLRFSSLSKTIQLSEHDFLVIGSRPGAGKTGFALNLLEDISQKYNCVYFNMEMSEQQVLRRLVGINSKIPMTFYNNPASDYQSSKVKEAADQIATRKIKVITGVQTMAMIKSTIIKEQKKEHTVVFVDYIGLIHSKTKNQSIYERVTEIAKELRMLSMNYECTIICIAQINRLGDNKPPLLSELKDSGELEQSAVNVILLHNENYYKKLDKKVEELQCIVAKNRNGRTGIIKVDYDQFNQRIEETNKGY